MSNNHRKILGIIGGMGPLATADLFSKIIAHTKADSDQTHLHILIDNNTDIPDRTKAILAGGENPLPALIASAERLRLAGAEFLIMPCNTAHYYYEPLRDAAGIPVLNMLEETAVTLKEREIGKIGLLATDGTIRSGVYHRILGRFGIEIRTPDEEGQREVMRVIYDVIKAGHADAEISGFRATCESLLNDGAETLVLGCTELPPAFSRFSLPYNNIDPTLVLAAAAIRYAGAEYI